MLGSMEIPTVKDKTSPTKNKVNDINNFLIFNLKKSFNFMQL